MADYEHEILLQTGNNLEELLIPATLEPLEAGIPENGVDYKIYVHDHNPDAHKNLQEKYDKKITDLDNKLTGQSDDDVTTLTLNGIRNKINKEIDDLDSSVSSATDHVLTGVEIENGKIIRHSEKDLTNFYQFKGSVDTEGSLPKTGNRSGDVYSINQRSSYGMDGQNVAWVVDKSEAGGGHWDPIGARFFVDYASYQDVYAALNA